MRARLGAAALLTVVAMALVGCVGKVQTQIPYDPSDGVGVEVGSVRVLNLIVLTEDGEDGNLIGAAVNHGDRDVELVFQYGPSGDRTEVAVDVPADATVHLGTGEEGQLLLPGIDRQPGDLIEIYVQYGDEQGALARVPVLDGALPEYADHLPTPMPTPTETAAPEPTETPAP